MQGDYYINIDDNINNICDATTFTLAAKYTDIQNPINDNNNEWSSL